MTPDSKSAHSELDGGQMVPDVLLDQASPLGPTYRDLAAALHRAGPHLSVTPMDEWDTTSELLYQVSAYARGLEEQLEAQDRLLMRAAELLHNSTPPRDEGWHDRFDQWLADNRNRIGSNPARHPDVSERGGSESARSLETGPSDPVAPRSETSDPATESVGDRGAATSGPSGEPDADSVPASEPKEDQ